VQFKSSVALSLIAAMMLAGCGAGSGVNNPAGPLPLRPQTCLQGLRHVDDCGGGIGGSTGGTFDVAPVSSNGYTSYGSGNWNTYTASGYDTSSGAIAGTSSGSASTSVTDGTEHWTAHVPSISSNAINITAVSGHFLKDGTNYLPGNITLRKNATATGGSIATFTDARGRAWRIAGELAADGHNVNMTFTASGIGQWTQTFDARSFAPTELSSTSTALRQSAVHTMGVTAGDVAAVAGAVAGVAGAVAGIAAVVPGGQGVAGVAGVIAGLAGCVAGVAAAIDHFETSKS
jgi:hypothetical protein